MTSNIKTSKINLFPKTTALILIDLQKGSVAWPSAPHSTEEVLKKAKGLADRFRDAGATVVLVNYGFSPDYRDTLRSQVDLPFEAPPGGYPADFSDLVDGLKKPGDICITKRQWGALYDTGLELQLRRRGIDTVVLGGISTNIGVESTGRAAYDLGFAVILAEDATSSLSAEMHEFAVNNIFPRIGRVTTAENLALVRV